MQWWKWASTLMVKAGSPQKCASLPPVLELRSALLEVLLEPSTCPRHRRLTQPLPPLVLATTCRSNSMPCYATISKTRTSSSGLSLASNLTMKRNPRSDGQPGLPCKLHGAAHAVSPAFRQKACAQEKLQAAAPLGCSWLGTHALPIPESLKH